MRIRNTAIVWSAVLLLVTLFVMRYSGMTTSAQGATPTPGLPLLVIPTSTPLPTPTLSPVQIISTLDRYGLQPGDLPAQFAAQETNGTLTLDELSRRLAEKYPDQAVLVQPLMTLYQTYGVVGSHTADYFVANCTALGIFGVGTWVRASASSTNAAALLADDNLAGLYEGLFNWRPAALEGLPGRVYQQNVPSSECALPATRYIVEYANDRLIVAVSVWALNTTDSALVSATLLNVINLINARLAPVELIASAAQPTATPTQTPAEPGMQPVTRNADWTPIIRDFGGVEMVLVPAGCFMMGSVDGEPDEEPVHEVCFDAPFWIDRYEVTNEQFAAFNGEARRNSRWNQPMLPREMITWREAHRFCARRGARLPTEAEWEYAARGPDNLIYPFGNTFVPEWVIYEGSPDSTADVRTRLRGASWVGALDMAGNVWEWTSSAYRSYPYDADDGRNIPTDDETLRVLRGGSWRSGPLELRAAQRKAENQAHLQRAPRSTDDIFFRHYYEEYQRYAAIGFRCARDY